MQYSPGDNDTDTVLRIRCRKVMETGGNSDVGGNHALIFTELYAGGEA